MCFLKPDRSDELAQVLELSFITTVLATGQPARGCPVALEVVLAGRSAPAPPPPLRIQIPGGPPLPTAGLDRRRQIMQRNLQCSAVRRPTAPLTLREPVDRRLVPTLAVAAAAGRHLVLDPGGPTLDLRHQVIGGRLDEAAERPATPHAAGAVPNQHGPQALGAILAGRWRGVGQGITRDEARAARRSVCQRSTARTDPRSSRSAGPAGRSFPGPSRPSGCRRRRRGSCPSRSESVGSPLSSPIAVNRRSRESSC